MVIDIVYRSSFCHGFCLHSGNEGAVNAPIQARPGRAGGSSRKPPAPRRRGPRLCILCSFSTKRGRGHGVTARDAQPDRATP